MLTRHSERILQYFRTRLAGEGQVMVYSVTLSAQLLLWNTTGYTKLLLLLRHAFSTPALLRNGPT